MKRRKRRKRPKKPLAQQSTSRPSREADPDDTQPDSESFLQVLTNGDPGGVGSRDGRPANVSGVMMDRRAFIGTLGSLAALRAAEAQPAVTPVIGLLGAGTRAGSAVYMDVLSSPRPEA